MVFLTILMLLITFISCDNKLNVSHTNAVRFSTEIGRKATANSEWQADDEVGIYMVAHDALAATAASERANKLYTADTAFQTSGFTPATTADTLKWDDISNSTATHFDFIAYYPYVSPIADTTALSINVYPLGSGEQDTGKADFLWGRTDNVQNNTSTVHLKLDHMLSRLIVNISPSTTVDATAINDATGGFTATVTGLNTQTAINLNDGTLDAASVIDAIVMKDISDTLTQSERNEGKRRFEAVLIPVGNTDALANVSLEFTLSGGAKAGTYTWKPSTTGAVAEGDKHLIHFDKGKQHVYNMTLNTDDNEVAVAAIQIEIKDWDTGDGVNAAATKAYSLTFGANEATGGSAPGRMYAHEGSLVTLPAPGTLEKDFYYFYGWNTLPNGNGTQYAAGDTFVVPDHDVTLYARWLVKVKAVSAGGYHTMILKEDDTLWGTGRIDYDQLGIGIMGPPISTPMRVKVSMADFITDVAAVSAGENHTMILKKDLTLWAAGRNNNGQLGVGDNNPDSMKPVVQVKASPVKNDFMTDVKEVSAGAAHTMILKEDDALWATGANYYGQLGDGTIIDKTTIPVQVMTNVAAVSAGLNHTMIVKKDGTLWATGRNNEGQLGDGTTTLRGAPVRVKDDTDISGFMTDVAAVFAGYEHTMILKTDGTLWATGGNSAGQLGDGTLGTEQSKSTPVQVKDDTDISGFMTDVAAVSAGWFHTMILKKDGTLWATGSNSSGQLGDGTTTTRTTPKQVMTDVAAVSVGYYHTIILKKDGTLWAAGWNGDGQLGIGTALTTTSTPVQVIF
ncbi:fimbrillin family protein [Parasphaerochaeta coccoides]|uniref:Listeria/Bacterioides repeat-containing protein n=1 Tax=Parasphaerochaeta coccoides (strain ATCC BAA-1237 / DSM 17374 / SPN1) TaxID=760011 RepID=F4GJE8_PARC1|nr:fimbrillin family protein [Parasphaerochaeta coccoides]AEC02213.1 Listeria/Bacterioides repeat-containing protein [Parasphaerochaeta coccoides DSM 17374]